MKFKPLERLVPFESFRAVHATKNLLKAEKERGLADRERAQPDAPRSSPRILPSRARRHRST